MEKLLFDKTDLTPSVTLNPQANVFEIVGPCLPEDAFSFFDVIIKYLESYSLDSTFNPYTLNITIDYCNSATSKMLLILFDSIAKQQQQQKNIKVVWHCFADDVDLFDTIEEYNEITNVGIETSIK